MRILCSCATRWRAGLLVCAVLMANAAAAQSVSYGVSAPRHAELETLTVRAMRLYQSGNTRAAVRAFEAASATAEKRFGAHDLQFVQSLNNLALIYDLTGALDRAETVYRRAIKIVIDQSGAAPAELAGLRNNLAAVVLQQCRVGDAQVLYRKALDLSEKALGRQHVDTRMMRRNVERLDRYLAATAPIDGIGDDPGGIGRLLQRCVG